MESETLFFVKWRKGLRLVQDCDVQMKSKKLYQTLPNNLQNILFKRSILSVFPAFFQVSRLSQFGIDP